MERRDVAQPEASRLAPPEELPHRPPVRCPRPRVCDPPCEELEEPPHCRRPRVDGHLRVVCGRGVESTTGAVAVGGGGSCSRRLSPMPVPHSSPWLRFQSPLVGRVESWRAAGRVRWLLRRFRTGPQSGSREHVSSSRLVKPSMPISGTGLSCCLRLKGYAAFQAGSAFGR